MADQPLAEMVEIAVREFTSDANGIQQSSHTAERDDSNPTGKRRRVELAQLDSEEGEESIQALLYSASKTLCLRLDAIEADLNSMEDKCKCLRAKVDMLANQNALRPPLAKHQVTEGMGSASSAAVPKAPSGTCLDSIDELPCPEEDLPSPGPAGEESGVQDGLQGLGPGVRIVAVCADGRGDGEERAEGSVALLPDATNLLYQLMY